MKKTTFLHLVLGAVVLAAALVPTSARAAAGDLYVPDGRSGTIFKFTPAGTQSTFASGLSVPTSLAFDSAGNLYVGDAGSSKIFKFAPDGTKSTFASGLLTPADLAFDGAGDLYVTDQGNGMIFKFTPAGTKSTFASGLNPAGLAFDSAGNLFVADYFSGTIFKFTPSGTRSTFASGLSDPNGLAFDGAGNLYEADFNTNTIMKFTPAGTKSTFASGLTGPIGLAFDGAGNLYEASSDTIFKFTPAGTKSTFASVGSPGYLAFEPLPQKLLNLSTRGFVQTGGSVLIAGFILGGNAIATNAVLMRALGPTLTKFGVSGALQDPTLELHNAAGAIIASNNNWQDIQAAQITATGLAPPDPRESAIFAILPAGNYSAIVRGVSNTTGVALVEVYSVQ